MFMHNMHTKLYKCIFPWMYGSYFKIYIYIYKRIRMGRWKNGCTYFFLCNPNHQIYLDLMPKEKEDKHTTIRGKGKNPEVEKVTKK